MSGKFHIYLLSSEVADQNNKISILPRSIFPVGLPIKISRVSLTSSIQAMFPTYLTHVLIAAIKYL